MRGALLGLVVLLARPALAVEVKATIDPATVAVGESADLAVAVDGSQSAPTPQIGGTAGLSVSYVGPASQMSWVNGRMSASITHHFSVVGTKPGRYTIGPITAEVDGERFDAGSVTLEVSPAGAAAGAAGGAGANDQIVLELTVPRTEVYLHERLPLRVKLLVGAVRVTDLQYPTVPGDGVAIDKFPEPAQRREQTSRGAMQVVDFQTTLTPLKAGTITLGPATMAMSLVVQSRRDHGLFGGFFGTESRPLQLQSQPLTLTVLPLPTEGRPADFGGAVGRFTFEVTAQPADVAAGDPVTVRSIVRGDGSLDGVAPPAISGSETLRVYPPQAAQATRQGERAFEQVVIPLRDGATALPVPRFSYFDPTARAYRTIAPPPVALTVRPSAHAKATPEMVGGAPAPLTPPARPETLGKDIVFIKDAPGTLHPIGGRRYRSPLWWTLQVVPVLLWLGAGRYARQRSRLAGDVRYARFTRAGRETRAALARARDALAHDRVAEGHDAVAAAVRDYLAAKLDLPPGTVSESAPARLRAAGTDSAAADEVTAFFAAEEAGRFAPSGASRAELEQALARAEKIVAVLERSRRLGRGSLAVLALAGIAATALAAGEGPTALFFRANGLYGNEQYAAAAEAYEKVLAAGVESGAVQYNLGNAYYKAGDVGRAVLAYERASRLIPGDPDLHANLAFARDLAKDVVSEAPLPHLVFPLASRVATDDLCVVAAGAWWACWGLLVLGVLVPSLERVARTAAGVAAVAGLVVASSAAYEWWTVEHPTFAVVVAHDDATVRSEPTPSATALFVAKPGTVLRVERTRETASLVTSRDGRRGWVESAALATI